MTIEDLFCADFSPTTSSFRMPESVSDTLAAIQDGEPFTTEGLEEAAKFFRACQDEIDGLNAADADCEQVTEPECCEATPGTGHAVDADAYLRMDVLRLATVGCEGWSTGKIVERAEELLKFVNGGAA